MMDETLNQEIKEAARPFYPNEDMAKPRTEFLQNFLEQIGREIGTPYMRPTFGE